MSWSSKIRSGLQVTKDAVINSKAELIMIFFSFGYHIPEPYIQNLIIQKLCLQMKYPIDYCLSSKINETIEEKTQGEAAKYLMYRNLVLKLPSVILSLFMGRWSDKYGRKLLLIMTCTGCAISLILYWLNYVFMDCSPIFVVLSAIPAGLGGEYQSFMMGIFGYVRDLHPMGSLSVRVSTADGSEVFSAQLGLLISVSLFSHYGYAAMFWSCAFMLLAAIVCAAVFVKDEKFKKERPCLMLRDYFKTSGFISSFTTTFKKRKGHLRAYILCVLATATVVFITNAGETELMFLYARLLLQWDVIKMNLFNAIQGAGQIIGCFVILPIFVHKFHWSDATLGLIGLVAKLTHHAIIGFARNSTVFYCVATLSALRMLTIVTFRSIITKCIPFNDMGGVMSIYAIMQAGSSNLGQIMATQIYSHTYTFSPGAYFIFSSALCFLSIAFYTWIYIDLKQKNVCLEKICDAI